MRRIVTGSVVIVAFSWLALLGSPRSGTIQGKVLDQNAKPVSDAKVTASLADSPEQVAHFSTTDRKGRFVIADLPWGKYSVGAEKPDAAYPNTSLIFYNDGATPAPLRLEDERFDRSSDPGHLFHPCLPAPMCSTKHRQERRYRCLDSLSATPLNLSTPLPTVRASRSPGPTRRTERRARVIAV